MNGIAPATIWAIVALVLALAELVVPGVFLMFLAIGAAVTAAIALALPDLAPAAQLGAFGVWSAAAVLIGRRWYRDFAPDSDDALLNDRVARLIGELVVVEVTIEAGRGRVIVGDGTWPATGPDLPAGAKARVTAIEGGIVRVEAAHPTGIGE